MHERMTDMEIRGLYHLQVKGVQALWLKVLCTYHISHRSTYMLHSSIEY